MLKQKATIFRRLMILLDICLVGGAFVLAYFLRSRAESFVHFEKLIWLLLFFVALWSFFLYASGMYQSLRLKKLSEIFLIVYQAAYFSFFVFAGLCYLLHIEHISRIFIFLAFALAMIVVSIEKVVIMQIFKQLRKKGFNHRSILIVGTGSRAMEFVKWINKNREFGLKVIGFIDEDSQKVGQIFHGHKVLGTLKDIPRIQKENTLDQVLFSVPCSWFDRIEQSMNYLETVGVKVDIALDYFGQKLIRAKQTDFLGVPLLSFENAPEKIIPLVIKRFVDIVLSFIALILLAPIFLCVALMIKMTSPGPVFFVQQRGSLNGRKFNLYKFRTMVIDAEAKLEELKALNEMKGPAFKINDDPRITKVGKIMRKLSVDELPQFWNVFLGDMSLVGPRPPIVDEIAEYDDWQRRRLSMRPGITCLWQVNGRNKITDFDQWAKLDLDYIDSWSLWLDVEILLKTVPVVLFGIGAK